VIPVFVALTPLGLATARRAQAALGGEVHALVSASSAGHPFSYGEKVAAEQPDEGVRRRKAEPDGERRTPSPVAFGDTLSPREREGATSAAPMVVFLDPATEIRSLFASGRPLVGICAAGILIRILAPLLSDKREEPPVIAVSEDGAEIVPLLGGHHGANELARRIAVALGGHAAITTAGDRRFGVALDAPPPGWTLANPQDAKGVMAALLAGAEARLEGEATWLRASRLPFAETGPIHLVATTRAGAGAARMLVYHPKRLVVGLGCERGADPAEAIALVTEALDGANLASASIACIASIDLKADELAVLEAARHFGAPARFFSAEQLEAESPRLANPSEAVFKEVGCHGVAEGAALAAAGREGKLVVAKRKSARVTCAITEAPDIIGPSQVGRARGRLAIVGIGPGSPEWLTPEARKLLTESDAAVGYSLYLDLVAPLIAWADRFDSELGSEEDRVRRALSLAGAGRSVALVSSGDAGIYAMATLAFECLEAGGLPDGACRAEIVVAPGISAMQAAAARAGAPLGHDFCAISLSDLLTPWEAIEARIQAAALADFVIAFYNPVSRRRRTQLDAAKAILLKHRPPQTPVILARNLGRDGETVTTVPLAALDIDSVDMLTMVLVGASTTRQVKAGGSIWTYTPRGYGNKRREADAAEQG